jgi:hypothetical protein
MIEFGKYVSRIARVVLSVVLLVSSSSAQNKKPTTQAIATAGSSAYGHLQPYFIENKGQWGSEVKFLFRSGGMDMWITDHGVIYDIHNEELFDTSCNPISFATRMDPRHRFELGNQLVERTGHVVRMDFAKSTTTPIVTGTGQQIGIYNYFLGNDSTKWVTNVHTYSGITIENLYPGVDAVFYLDNGMPRYDLLTKPGADLTQIEMQWKGQDSLSLDNCGNLRVKTMMSDLMQSELLAYQMQDGVKEQVACKFQLGEYGVVRFEVGQHDLLAELVIDPVMYSTFLGGVAVQATGIAVDASGDAFVTGYLVSSPEFPTTPGAYQTIPTRSSEDVFVTKLNSVGSQLIYSTFVGGGWPDGSSPAESNCIAVDRDGNAYIAGHSWSIRAGATDDYPTTRGAIQSANNGGVDAFVTKLNSTGSALVYSTYLGGEGTEDVMSIALDLTGAAYVAGFTTSQGTYPSGFPTTSGSYQMLSHSGKSAFVSKLNAAGTAFLYSTVIGDTATSTAKGIAVDVLGNAYITGFTTAGFPTTTGAIQTVFGGADDAFVTKLNTTGTSLVYSTFLGGPGQDEASGIVIDASGNASITGFSEAAGFPTTGGTYQPAYHGATDAFVSKLNASGTALIYSMYIGGTNQDAGIDIALDDRSDAVVTGYTFSTDYPVTHGAYQTNSHGSADCFVSELDTTGSQLLYSSYIGGLDQDEPAGIAIDPSGYMYIAGSSSGAYPTTHGAFDTLDRASNDPTKLEPFITKLAFSESPVSLQLDSISTPYCGTTSVSCLVKNATAGTMVLDSASVQSPFSLAGLFPLSLPADSEYQLLIQFRPQADGAYAEALKLYFHTSDGTAHDTTLLLAASANAAFASITNALTITAQPLSPVDVPVNLTLSIVRLLDTMQVNQIDFTVSYDSVLLDMNPGRLASQIMPPVGLTYGSAEISPGLLHVTLKNPAGTKLTNSLTLGDLVFTAYKGAAKSTLVTLSTLSVTTSSAIYDYCTDLEGDYIANVVVEGSGVSQSSSASSLRLFPNPAKSGEVTLELTSAQSRTLQIAVYDILGREQGRRSARLNAGEKHDLALPTSGLAPGNYYVRVADGVKVQTEKLAIE